MSIDMSIDAKVETVVLEENGWGELKLVDRPKRPGGYPGIAGQRSLWFAKAPEEVTALNGLEIWGGDSSIILGERKIADRKGYTQIVFVDSETFKQAVAEYHGKHYANQVAIGV